MENDKNDNEQEGMSTGKKVAAGAAVGIAVPAVVGVAKKLLGNGEDGDEQGTGQSQGGQGEGGQGRSGQRQGQGGQSRSGGRSSRSSGSSGGSSRSGSSRSGAK